MSAAEGEEGMGVPLILVEEKRRGMVGMIRDSQMVKETTTQMRRRRCLLASVLVTNDNVTGKQ